MKVSAIFSAIMLVVFLLLSPYIMTIFVKDAEVIAIGAFALKVSACFYVFLGTIHVTRGLLNGAGDVKFAFMNGVTEVVGRIGFASILVHIPAVEYMAVWGTTCLTWVLTAIMSVIRYKNGKWKDKFTHL